MFFQIKFEFDNTFPTHIKLTDTLWLNADEGWSEHYVDDTRIIFKGYLDDSELTDDVLQTIAYTVTPVYSGNFIAVVTKNNSVSIRHDTYRSFLLYVDDNSKMIHNMQMPFTWRVPSDQIITFGNDLVTASSYFDPIGLVEYDRTRSKSEVIEEIDLILENKFKTFFAHNTLPVKLFVSGGIDTIICWAYIKSLNIPYELVVDEHIAQTKFVQNYLPNIAKHWSYFQIHSWYNPTLLVTGASGDELMMRNPYIGNLWLQLCGTSYPEELQPHHYHYINHFLPSRVKHYEEQNTLSKNELIDKILSIIINDHQHWHLDNTITFTPFKDIRLIKLMLQLPFDDIKGQLLDAEISKALVTKRCPQLLRHLVKHKDEYKLKQNKKDAIKEDK